MSEREELEAVIETAVNKALDVAGQTGGFPPFRERIATALLSSGYAKGNGELVRGVAVPAGYVLVPLAPTEEMAMAGDMAILTADLSVIPLPSWQTARVCYAAMLSALPNDAPNVDVNRLIEVTSVKKKTADEITAIIREWLDAEDPTHWGKFETDLDAALEGVSTSSAADRVASSGR